MQYPYLIIYARGIFMDKPIDPNWTIQNDRQSVTVGINTRLWILNKRETIPALIRLGREHTRLFLKEAGMHYIPNKKPQRIIHQNLFWDDERGGFCYSKRMIPIKFNDPKIHGIAVEGVPKPEKPKKPKKPKKKST
jgi:hypothetical protein